MAKLSLNNIDNESVPSASVTISENNDAIETWSDSVLSRDGTSPNQMEADLDMNSHRILNLPAARASVLTDVVRVGDLEPLVAGMESLRGPTGFVESGDGGLLSINNLSDVDSAASSRANLGLEIGVDVLAHSDTIQEIEDIAWSNESLLWKNGSGDVASLSISSAVQDLLGANDLTSFRSDLGLGDCATLDVGTGAGTVAAGNDSRFTKLTIVGLNSNATLSASYAGAMVRHTSGLSHTYTIPPFSSGSIPAGAVIQVRNNVGGGPLTIARGAGVYLSRAGSTTNTNVVLNAGALVTLIHEFQDFWIVSGAGIS